MVDLFSDLGSRGRQRPESTRARKSSVMRLKYAGSSTLTTWPVAGTIGEPGGGAGALEKQRGAERAVVLVAGDDVERHLQAGEPARRG